MFIKSQIAQSFSKAASTYDTSADFQKNIGHLLLKNLENLMLQPNIVMDIGCGTGYFTQKIAEQYPQAQVKGADIAPGMVTFATQNYAHPNVTYTCADADDLPFMQTDLIFSNLMLQWSPNLSHTLKAFKRILSPKGHLTFSTLIRGTLFELKSAWQAIDPHSHVHPFLSYEEITQLLAELGFKMLQIQQTTYTLYYPSLKAFFLSLKSLGAHNLQSTRLKGLSGKNTWRQLTKAYEKFCNSHKIPVTYKVMHGIVQ